jgi:hypothetical protein
VRFMLRRWLIVVAAIATALTISSLAGIPAQAAPRQVAGASASASAAQPSGYTLPAGVSDPCPAPSPGQATCATLIGASSGASPNATTTTPAGYGPSDLRSAYGFPSASSGSGQTVAVVTAYDDPNAAADLATYRTQYGITACTTANGCFKKVDQTGGSSYPSSVPAWSTATAEGVDMISAVCPNCHILLVEATSTSISDLGTAENEAASLGAKFIDNTWYTGETGLGASETTYDSQYFNHPGAAITAPDGGGGYGTVNYPAASQYVTAVGSTTLVKNTSTARGWTETASSSTSSGCSAYEPKPTWQTDTGCSMRTLSDVAAVGDASPPDGSTVAVYNTANNGWEQVGDTTLAAAIIASTYALAGSPAPGTYPASYPYTHPGGLYDISSGSTGTCSPSYLCTAGPGYDGPTGLGTPNAATAFWGAGARPAAIVGKDGTLRVFVHATDGSVQQDALASGSSTWSGLTSLGGNWPASPAALAGGGGFIWVFEVGTNGNLYVNDLPNTTTWSGWTDIGNPGSHLIGVPAAVQDKNGTIRVYTRNSAGSLYEITLASGTSTWSAFNDLGGTWPFDPAANVGSGGYVKVFEIGTTTSMYTKQLAPGGSWPSAWTDLGGTVTGDPAAVQDNSGTTRVYARDTHGSLEEFYSASGTTTWTEDNRNGTWSDDAAASVGSGGFVKVFDIGTTTNMYYDQLPPGKTWSGWTEMNGTLTGVPAATQASNGTDYAFARGTGGSLQVDSEPGGSSTWSGFSSLGGAIS